MYVFAKFLGFGFFFYLFVCLFFIAVLGSALGHPLPEMAHEAGLKRWLSI